MKIVKLRLALLTFSLVLLNKAFAQNAYIKTDVINTPGVTNDAQIDALLPANRESNYMYMNGLGEVSQAVGYAQSPGANDIIQLFQYDQAGGRSINFLPYADNNSANAKGSYRSSAIADLQNYYSTNSTTGNLNKVANNAIPFSQKIFENSPLHRLTAIGDFGIGFQPDLQDANQHYTTAGYRNNTAADNVMITPAAGGSTFYSANTLSVTDIKTSDGSEILVFRNTRGQVILRRTVSGQSAEPYYDTYYVFNADGSVAYVIPPAATNLIVKKTFTNLAAAPLSNLVYAYTYDAIGRLVTRKIPNTGAVNIIYDPLNRPLLMQDANQAQPGNNKWTYIKYDIKGRPVSHGIYTDNTNIGQLAMQSYVDQHYGSLSYESRSSSAATWYYTNVCFPVQNLQPMGFAFYDDYDLTQSGSPYYHYQAQGMVNSGGANIEVSPTSQTDGLLTMYLQRSVGTGLSDIWMSSVCFYDAHGRSIQVQTNNQLNFVQNTITDYRTVAADFTGKPLQMKVSKTTGASATNTVLTTFTYDSNNKRLQSVQQAYNAQAPVTLSNYAYNDLGQLVTKQLGFVRAGTVPDNINLNTTYSGNNTFVASSSITLSEPFSVPSGSVFSASISNNYLQTLDYRYNIRGQTLSVNNSALSNDNGVTNSDNSDLFGVTYLYDQADANLSNMSSSFTGKLAAAKWSYRYKSGVSNERSYVYKYDQLGQLSKALYAERLPNSSSATPFNVNVGGFDETNISYNDNGSILGLQRNYSSNNGAGGTPLDNLHYTYDTANPDRLYQVVDAVTTVGNAGFNNVTGTGSGSFYQYDANGNLINDPYKGISITYNPLNKTDVISAPSISNSAIKYTYRDGHQDALRKQVFKNGALQGTVDYVDEFVYSNGALSYLSTLEGRALNTGGTIKPEYIIKDQQGNARVGFQDDGSGNPVVTQENSYYAYGEVMPNSLVSTLPTANNNLYNGDSEWQNSFQNLPDYYQTDSRNYDPAIGRFIAVDPMAELSASLSNYHYAANNPVMNNDPSGNCPPEDDDDAGCPVIVPIYTYDEDLVNMGYGGGGSGDPGEDYSNNSVPASPSSYGGNYNNGSPSGNAADPGSMSGAQGVGDPSATGPASFDDAAFMQNGTTLQNLSQAQNGQAGTGPGGVDSFGIPFDRSVRLQEVTIVDQYTGPSEGRGDGSWYTPAEKLSGDINTGIAAFSVGLGAQNELMDFAVRTSFKSARTWSEFNALRETQQVWRASRALGKTGAELLNGTKVLGAGAAVLSIGITLARAGGYYAHGGHGSAVAIKAGLDAVMTGVGFFGPVGFGISSAYFIIDAATNGFGGYGKIE